MSLNIIAMVESTAPNENTTTTSQCVNNVTPNISAVASAAWVALPDVSFKY